MRRRMRRELGSKTAETFHLKQDSGGIMDIEFMIQYGVLAWSQQDASLTEWTDAVRILDSFADRKRMSEEDARNLKDAYLTLRARGHQLALQERKGVASPTEFAELRNQVTALWNRHLGEPDHQGD